MSCHNYVEAMSSLLDGTPSEALEAHLAECPACRTGFDSMRAAHEALRAYPAASWKPEMTDAVLRRAESAPATPWRWVGVAAGLAAAVALAILVWPNP